MHGRRHVRGGSDPIPFEWSWCLATRSTDQTIDSSAEEVAWTDFATNDSTVFELDTSGASSGVLVKMDGMYQTFAMVEAARDVTVTRQMYVQAQAQSVYPVFGVEFGSTHGVALDSSLIDGSNLRLNHFAIGGMSPLSATDYERVIVAAVRIGGVNYTVTYASLAIFRIGNANLA